MINSTLYTFSAGLTCILLLHSQRPDHQVPSKWWSSHLLLIPCLRSCLLCHPMPHPLVRSRLLCHPMPHPLVRSRLLCHPMPHPLVRSTHVCVCVCVPRVCSDSHKSHKCISMIPINLCIDSHKWYSILNVYSSACVSLHHTFHLMSYSHSL